MSNGFSQEQQALIRQVAFEAAEKTVERFSALHIESCPYGKRIERFRWTLTGVAIAFGIMGAATGATVAKLLMAL